MIYRVVLTPRVDADLRAAYRYIRKESPRAARDWIRRARLSIRTLSQHPERCSTAPESASLERPIRELLFGSGNRGTYRVLFLVLQEKGSVYVLHVRHGSMLSLEPVEQQLQYP